MQIVGLGAILVAAPMLTVLASSDLTRGSSWWISDVSQVIMMSPDNENVLDLFVNLSDDDPAKITEIVDAASGQTLGHEFAIDGYYYFLPLDEGSIHLEEEPLVPSKTLVVRKAQFVFDRIVCKADLTEAKELLEGL